MTTSAAPQTPHDYFALGMLPIPVPTRTKKCVLEGWSSLTRETVDLATAFPDDGPRLGIGVVLGAASGRLADADLDCPQALIAGKLLLPDTGWLFGRSGNPRSHYLFRPTGRAAIHKEYKDVDGTKILELRSDKHMTVVPPSIHESGEQIEWECFEQVGELLVEDLEAAVDVVAAATLLARHWPSQGSRQDAALALSGGLCRAGWDVERIEKFVEAVSTAAGDEEAAKRVETVRRTHEKIEAGEEATGWPTLGKLIGDEVVQRVTTWLCMDFGTEPWLPPIPLGELPEVPPFPLEVFPPRLQRFVREAAAAVPCPPDYPAVTILTMAGALAGKSRALAIKRRHNQRGNLFLGVVGMPGGGKTPGIDMAMEPIEDTEEELHAKFKEAQRKYQQDLEKYETDLKEAKENNTTPPAKPVKPILQRHTVDDVTVEALVPILQENPRGVAQVCDEITAIVQRMNCYREGGKGSDRQFYLSAWSGKSYCYDRKKDREAGPIRLRNIFLTLFGVLPPVNLPTLRGFKTRQKVDSDGWFDRMLWSYPVEVLFEGESWEDVSDAAAKSLATVFKRLTRLKMVAIDAKGAALTSPRPFLLGLTPQAKIV
jgi:hypothetical protein